MLKPLRKRRTNEQKKYEVKYEVVDRSYFRMCGWRGKMDGFCEQYSQFATNLRICRTAKKQQMSKSYICTFSYIQVWVCVSMHGHLI